MYKIRNRVFNSIAASVLYLTIAGVASAQTVDDFYLPLPEATALTFLDNINNDADAPLITRTDIVIRDVNTQIIFDDGVGVDAPNTDTYETQYAIPANWPVGTDTEIWGDNNCSNGFNPNLGATCVAGDDVFSVGEVIVLDQTAAIAGDYFRANRVVNLTRSLWATGSGTLLAGAFELFPTAQWGTSYVLPVGENAVNSNSMFQQTALTIMAKDDNTVVTIDPDGPTNNTAALITATIDKGESLNVGMGGGANGQGLVLNVGATITSTAPIQANVLTGDINSSYESRFYTLFPDSLLSSEYYEAVGTTVATDGVTIFVYNPNDTAIVVEYFDSVNPTVANGTLNLAANGLIDLDVLSNTGIRLASTGDEVFTAYTVVDDAGQDHDWGHVTTPLRLMGDRIRVGFAPGKDPESGSTENASPIWVVADEPGSDINIEICVDNAGDGIDSVDISPLASGTYDGRGYDYAVVASPLASTRLYNAGPSGTAGVNTNNGAQTGMLAFACDTGTNGVVADPLDVVIAAAWGQDPEFANPASPGFDAGTTIRTGSLNRLFLGDLIFNDVNGNGVFDPEDSGIEGVTVTITSSDPTVDVDPTTGGVQNTFSVVTDKSGLYLFSNLESNEDYTVTVTPPTNSTQTFDPDGTNDSTTSLTLGSSTLAVDFGYSSLNIGDRIFLDTNQDGDYDAGEGIDGVTVRLTPPIGVDLGAGINQPIETVTTNDGFYNFNGLPPGDYTVDVVSGIPAGANQTVDPDGVADESSDLTITLGNSNFDQDFGYFFADLGIVKTSSANGQAVSPGETITYTIVVTNEGLVTNTNVTVTDDLPSGVTYVNGTSQKTFPTTIATGTFTSPNLGPLNVDGVNPAIGSYTVTTGDGVPASATLTQVSFNTSGEAQAAVNSWLSEIDIAVRTPSANPLFSRDFGNDFAQPNNSGTYTNINDSSGASGTALGLYQLTFTEDTNDSGTDLDNIVSDATFTIDWVQSGIATNAANPPANLVVSADGVSLAPGESMTVTFDVIVDDPLGAGITELLNTAEATSDQTPTPVEDSVVDPVDTTASVAGRVWLDEDLDGINDIEEAGITAVIVELIDANGATVASQATDANGDYLFSDVVAGAYTVNVVDSTVPANLDNTAGPGGVDPKPVVVNKGDNVKNVDFGYIPDDSGEGAIGDRVWSDGNGNGIQDSGEPGIEGVVLSLFDTNGNPVLDSASNPITAITNKNGDYLLSGVPHGGDYIVTISDADPALIGYTPTSGPQSEGGYVGHPVSLSPALSVVTDVDFGFNSTTENNNSISDTVWFDENGDGIKDPEEPGIPGVSIDLYVDADNNGIADDDDDDGFPDVLATGITDENGVVSFTGLPDGNYLMGVTDNTSELADLDATTVEANASLSDPVALAGGASPTDTSFGYNKPGLISGTIYNDQAAANSDQDAGEAGFADVTVTLLQDTNNDGSFETTVSTTNTDISGAYSFVGLPAGSYQVQVSTPPIGSTQTEDPDALTDPDGATDNEADIVLGAGESSVENDFGYTGADDVFNLSGTVFLDPDKDGIEDVGEPGIEGVTLDLIDRDNVETYDIIGGLVDYNQDGVISAADNGVVDGVPLIAGAFDIDSSGVISGADDGTVGPYTIVDGLVSGAPTLNAPSDGVIATITTDSSGEYEFSGLPPGDYSVAVVDANRRLAGYDITSGLDVLDATIVASDVTDVDFGYIKEETTGSISGEVFIDENSDDTAQDSETDLSQVDVHLCEISDEASGELAFRRFTSASVTAISSVNEIDTLLTLVSTSTSSVFDELLIDNGTEDFGYIYNGYFNAATAGTYNFETNSDDGSVIIIDGITVVDNDGLHGNQTVDADVVLTAGQHTIEVRFFERDGGEVFGARFTAPGGSQVDLSTADLSPTCLPGIPGYVATTPTDTNGEYSFNELPPGEYFVSTDPDDVPPGLTETVTPPTVSLSEGEDVTDVDVGHEPEEGTGVLAGFTWTDVNGDGIYDSGEAPIAGVRVEVRDPALATPAEPSGPVIGFADTKADGSWIISGIDVTGDIVNGIPPLQDGYLVGYLPTTVPTGLNSVQPTNLPLDDINYFPVDLDSDPDKSISNLDFGYQPIDSENFGSIAGTIYSDLNADPGALGSYEEAIDGELAGVSVDLVQGGVVIATVLTDQNGDYQFSGLPDSSIDGPYSVIVTDNANVTKDLNTREVISNPITIDVNTLATRDITDQNAGYVSDITLNSIGNKFFFDTNGDGNLDEGEPGIAGITIQCWLDTDLSETPDTPSIDASAVVPQPGIDNLIRTVVTDESGEYYCTSLPAGQYIVVVKDSLNYSASDAVADTGLTADGEAKNWSYVLTLADDEANYTADFAVSGSNNISGYVRVEDEALVEPVLGTSGDLPTELDGTPGDGVDPLFPGQGTSPDTAAEGVPVQLLVLQDGEYVVIDTTTTDNNGFYQFINLPDGDYVVEVLPDGSDISGFGQTGDPSLLPGANGNEDLVCDSPTDAICDDRSTDGAIVLNAGNPSESGVSFMYQRDFSTTPVTMSYFKATRNGGSVEFKWETVNEVGNAGFQIYARGDKEWVLISELIVSANEDQYTTNTYYYEVSGVDAEWFSLVAVSTQEEITPHGPFKVGEEYGEHIVAPAEFDWSGIDRKQSTTEEVINSVSERLQRAMREDPEAFQ